jgi:hypothetical protein
MGYIQAPVTAATVGVAHERIDDAPRQIKIEVDCKEKDMKHFLAALKFRVGLGFPITVAILLISGCSDLTSGRIESPWVDSTELSWQTVEPGFSVGIAEGQISFDVDYTLFDESTYAKIDTAMRTLVSGNGFYEQEWLQLNEGMEANLTQISRQFGSISAFVKEVRAYELEQGLTLQAAGCTRTATAGPTTAGPGAKAYAKFSCSSQREQQQSSSSSTTAKAGNTRNTDSDSGRYESYASSSAYDTANTSDCYSRASVSQTYLFLGFPNTQESTASNSRCR